MTLLPFTALTRLWRQRRRSATAALAEKRRSTRSRRRWSRRPRA